MEKNKTGKYLKYAIGEIVLVVIGILIALQINNWNEQKKIQAKVHSFLISLKKDLTNDLSTINEIIKIQEERLEIITGLISLGISPNVSATLENNNATQVTVGRNFTFFPVVGSYKAASGSGLIENIENDALKNNILNLYEHYYNRLNYNGQLNDGRHELLEWESRMYSDYTKKKLTYDEAGLLDKDFLSQLGYVTRFINVYLGLANKTKLAIEDTIQSIEASEQTAENEL
jgi:hypothetical protein